MKKVSKKGCLGMFLFMIFIIFVISASIKEGCSSSNKLKKYTKIDALIASQNFVETRLTSPSSAEFSYDYENKVQQINDTTFRVVGWVDSQNGFGAMVRSNYTCTIIFYPKTEKVSYNNLIIK